MERIAKAIVKLKWLIIIVVIGLTAFFGYHINDIKINSDIINSLPDDDPAAHLYKEIGKEFGGNDVGMIVLETDNVYKTEVLEHIKQVTDSLKSMEGISTVTSLTDIIDIKGEEWGIEIGKLVDEYDLPNTPAKLDSLRQRILSKEMYKGAIVSEDGTATMIMFTTLDGADKQVVAKEIKEKVINMGLPEKLYFSGLPMMMNDVSDLIVKDLSTLLPIVFLIIGIVLLFSFKSVRGVALPLIVAAISVVWTIGTMAVLGYDMTMISNTIPIILFAVGSAYTIHVLNRINQCVEKDRKKALIKALGYVMIPVILAAITTMVGFVSFIFGAYMTMVKDFGIFTAMGTFFALLLSIFFVPAVIAAFSMYKKEDAIKKEKKKSFLTDKVLTPLNDLLFKHPKYSLIAWSILILIAIGGVFMIERSVNMVDYFEEGNPTRESEKLMQEKFGGSQPVFVVFEGDMQSPEVLKTMLKAEKYMKKNKDISFTQSVADLIEQMNDVMGEGKKIPDSKDKIVNLWFLLDGQDIMPQLVTDEFDKGVIQSRLISYDSKDMKAFIDYMDKFIDENSTDECKIQLTGMPSVYVVMDESLFNSQMSSLAIALILVLLIVSLIVRSFSKGVYATIPIIATIAILYGFMGYVGISLNVATVLVASVALGIGIDYSIHIITHFNHALKESGDIRKALENTLLVSGKAIIINVVSVSAGFLVLLFSQMVPLQQFGLLVSLSMLGSGLGALTLLPIILILAGKRKVRKANKINL
jgi:hydrophobe/amphiphile efflux-3 (HAE3) family protein